MRTSRAVTSNTGRSYPHEFLNREELDLSASRPWFEYPIFKDSTFEDNADPGVVRLIFSKFHDGYDVVYHDPKKNDNLVEQGDGSVMRYDFTKAVLIRQSG